jgi:hypothetical protein
MLMDAGANVSAKNSQGGIMCMQISFCRASISIPIPVSSIRVTRVICNVKLFALQLF